MYPRTHYDTLSKLGSLRAPPSRGTPRCVAYQVIWLSTALVIRQTPTTIPSHTVGRGPSRQNTGLGTLPASFSGTTRVPA